jgi:hypothetical protein
MRLREHLATASLSRLQHKLRRELWFNAGLAVALVGLAFGLALHFVQPAPPTCLVSSTGPADSE